MLSYRGDSGTKHSLKIERKSRRELACKWTRSLVRLFIRFGVHFSDDFANTPNGIRRLEPSLNLCKCVMNNLIQLGIRLYLFDVGCRKLFIILTIYHLCFNALNCLLAESEMARRKDGIIWHLMDAPWWLSVLLAGVIYLGLSNGE